MGLMGYYTSYELIVDTTHEGRLAMIGEAIKNDGEASYALDSTPIGSIFSGRESSKWYDHEDFLRRLSTDFPGVLFTLSGEGEEAGDIWKKYFRNGKSQAAKARITIDKFDPSRMV